MVGHTVNRQVPTVKRPVGICSVFQQQGDYVGVSWCCCFKQDCAWLWFTAHTGSSKMNTDDLKDNITTMERWICSKTKAIHVLLWIPFCNRTSATFRCPFCAARASGVFFLMSHAFGLAPDSRSRYTKFSRPKKADSCRAVRSSGPVWSILAL